eukprot:1161949-Pelagomonas_calceolata.AAC.3
MCPAVLPTAPETTKTWNPRQKVVLVLQAKFQAGCTSHCLPDTAGLPSSFVWEGSQSFRMGGALGGPGQPGVNFTRSRQP